jgi:hypothetical protein
MNGEDLRVATSHQPIACPGCRALRLLPAQVAAPLRCCLGEETPSHMARSCFVARAVSQRVETHVSPT